MRNAPRDAASPLHLSETQLVAYLDGELPRADQLAARAHLETCWTCRSRIAAVESSIETFLGARSVALPQEESLSENRVQQFEQRLARHAAESVEKESYVGSVLRSVRAFALHALPYRQAAIASIVVVTLLVVMFTDVLHTKVSADTVLARAAQYEQAQVPSSGHVTRTSIRIDRLSRRTKLMHTLSSMTLIRDSATRQTYLSARSADGKQDEGVASTAGLAPEHVLRTALADGQDANLQNYLVKSGWIPDVSVREFRELISERGETKSTAQRQGETFELQFPFRAGLASGIAEADLVVNATDYSPSRVSILSANGDSEYQFTRESFSTEPRTPEIARMFSPSGVVERSSRAPELPAKRLWPLTYADSHASDEEVRVSAALHQVDACLGEELYVFPMSDGSILVQGLVDTAARRQTIRAALQGASGPLRVEVFVPRELKSGSELYNPPDRIAERIPAAGSAASVATMADMSSANMPLYQRLYRNLSKPGQSADDTQKQIAVFSNEVVTAARQSFLHAWALKRLEREFAPERTAGLSAESLHEVEQMRQDHRRWIASFARRQSEMLSNLIENPSKSMLTESGELDSEALLRLAEQQNELVRSLFTYSSPSTATDDNLARLLAVLRQMGS